MNWLTRKLRSLFGLDPTWVAGGANGWRLRVTLKVSGGSLAQEDVDESHEMVLAAVRSMGGVLVRWPRGWGLEVPGEVK